MANVRRLAELSMVPPLAKEVASQIDSATGNVTALKGQFTLNGVTNVVVANTPWVSASKGSPRTARIAA